MTWRLFESTEKIMFDPFDNFNPIWEYYINKWNFYFAGKSEKIHIRN